jgi:hypothetical protein
MAEKKREIKIFLKRKKSDNLVRLIEKDDQKVFLFFIASA